MKDLNRKYRQHIKAHKKEKEIKNCINCQYFTTSEGKKELEYCEKYKLSSGFLPDPEKSYADLFGTKPEGKKGEIRFNFSQILAHYKMFVLKPKAVKLDSSEDKTQINIAIDFNEVNSIDSLKIYVSDLIEEYAIKKLPQKSKLYMTTEFDKILRIGDMREIHKLKRAEVAKQEYPDDESPESALTKVSYNHERYQNLINGGYKNITFP
jgi:hypothetical protein